MKRLPTLLMTAVVALFGGYAVAQMSGGGSGGGMGRQSSGGMMQSGGMQSGGMQGQMQGSMPGNSMSMPQDMAMRERREMMHTTPRQEAQYRAALQTMHAVRSDIDRMRHDNAQRQGSSYFDSSSATSALMNDIQTSDDAGNTMIAGLNQNQQDVLESQVRTLSQKTRERRVLVERIQAETSDPKLMRDDLKKLDKLTRDIAKRQAALAEVLGIGS